MMILRKINVDDDRDLKYASKLMIQINADDKYLLSDDDEIIVDQVLSNYVNYYVLEEDECIGICGFRGVKSSYYTTENKNVFIIYLGVNRVYQGKGYGKKIMKYMIDVITSIDNDAYIYASTDIDNIKCKGLLNSLNFTLDEGLYSTCIRNSEIIKQNYYYVKTKTR